jgi:Zn-finger nucleic acid-binding protein
VDLTGRFSGSGYRGIAVRCPGCAETMSAEQVGEAEVDVCGVCGGVWLDWFDGEPRLLATKIVSSGVVGRPSAPESLRNEPRALGACPRCTRQLVAERYTIDNAPGAKGTATGAELLRCEECAGVFVSRTAAETLATLPADDPPPPSETTPVRILEPLPWQRFLALLKRLVSL